MRQLSVDDMAQLASIAQRTVRARLASAGVQPIPGSNPSRWRSDVALKAILATESATSPASRLATAKAELAELELAARRRALAPISIIAEVLARMSSQIVAILESLPRDIRLKAPHLTPRDIKIVEEAIVRVRNVAADTRVDIDDLVAK